MTNPTKANAGEQQKGSRSNEAKWTEALMSAGFTVLPSIILDKQRALGIDSIDLNILLQLVKHWWKKDDLPYPSKDTLSELIGVSASAVRKRIQRLEKEGLVERISRYDTKGGQQSNFYKFDGLISKMTPYAQEAIDLRKQQQAERLNLRRKKRAARPKAPAGTLAKG
jgi:predicted transcriptional regulator